MVRVTVVSSGFKSWCSHYFWTYFGAGRGASEWHEELRGRGGDACVDWIWRARGGGSQIDVVAPSGCAGFGPIVMAGVTGRGDSPLLVLVLRVPALAVGFVSGGLFAEGVAVAAACWASRSGWHGW